MNFYFEALFDALLKELEADRLEYETMVLSSPVSSRREQGLSWYPIAIRGIEPAFGDYLMVELERTTHQDLPHGFRQGGLACLFSMHQPAEHRLNGLITWVGDNRLKLHVRLEELPFWTEDGKLGLDVLFDQNSYDEMFAALKMADELLSDKKRAPQLLGWMGMATPEKNSDFFQEDSVSISAEWSGFLSSLNNSQREAATATLSNVPLCIIHGPPGTGKTTTLIAAMKLLVQQAEKQEQSGFKILASAPSNAAVDLLTERLQQQGIRVVRLGNPARVSEDLQSTTLEEQMNAHPSMKEVKKWRKQAAAYRDMAQKYKRSFGPAEREQRKALFAEARKLMKEVEQTEQYIKQSILDQAQVITCTLVGASLYTLRGMQFEVGVIDEAGQAIEPACWIPALKVKKLILAGDPQQLPPTVKSSGEAGKKLTHTWLEKLMAAYPHLVNLLNVQYRMNEQIMAFSNAYFYQGKLVSDRSVAQQLLWEGDEPVQFIDTAGCGFEEKNEHPSIVNEGEAALLMKLLEATLSSWEGLDCKTVPLTVGVVAPYRAQVALLKHLWAQRAEALVKDVQIKVSVQTIDGFQGQERDVMVIGLTRSNDQQEIGFLKDYRRINVALTRAKSKLLIVGDSATLGSDDFYNRMIAYFQEHGGYHSAWEYEWML